MHLWSITCKKLWLKTSQTLSHVQEAQKFPNKMHKDIPTPRHRIIKMAKVTEGSKQQQESSQLQGSPREASADCCAEDLRPERTGVMLAEF